LVDFDQTNQRGNHLLAALTAETFAVLARHLHQQEFAPGTVLWQPGHVERQVYFPHSGLISLAIASQEGPHVEVASVCRQGAAGLHEMIDDGLPTYAAVLIGGTFSLLSGRQFSELEKHNAELRALADFSRNWILSQSQHMVVCNASHSAEARLCRWLLLAADRMETDTINVTQEVVAGMLGIRRTTVTLIAQKLQNEGGIRYSRGKISIRDRGPLLTMTCSCYHALDASKWPAHRLAAATAAGHPAISRSA
jgi:CRP-like cAMP-binding protein